MARHRNVCFALAYAQHVRLTPGLVADPYPFAIDECFDVYRTLVSSSGKIIGMSGTKFNAIFTGDSA